MDTLKKFFPQAFKATDLMALIVALVIYVIIGVVCGFVIGFLAKIKIIGFIFSLLGTVIGIYAFVGIILSLLVFFKVIK